MNSNIWAKTTLSAYPYLVRVADAIDRMVEKRALNSFYVTSANYASNNIYDIANQIIDLNERKKVLINLKILVEDCLKKCEKLHAKILIMKYISRKKGKEVASALGIVERTYYRKIREAEFEFTCILEKAGYDSEKLVSFLGDESWIMEIKSFFEKSGDESEYKMDKNSLCSCSCCASKKKLNSKIAI